jgi:hypothetical protein
VAFFYIRVSRCLYHNEHRLVSLQIIMVLFGFDVPISVYFVYDKFVMKTEERFRYCMHVYIMTYKSSARQRIDKHVPTETDSW